MTTRAPVEALLKATWKVMTHQQRRALEHLHDAPALRQDGGAFVTWNGDRIGTGLTDALRNLGVVDVTFYAAGATVSINTHGRHVLAANLQEAARV